MSAFDHPKGRTGCPLAVPRNYFFPGGLYKLATLEALSATALNSAPVQALEVVTSEIPPAAAAANNAAIVDSASLVSVMSRIRRDDGPFTSRNYPG